MSDPIETSSKTEEDKPALTFAKYGDEARRNDFELFLPRKKRIERKPKKFELTIDFEKDISSPASPSPRSECNNLAVAGKHVKIDVEEMSDPIETSSKTEEDKPALTFAKYGDEARRNDFELFLPRKRRIERKPKKFELTIDFEKDISSPVSPSPRSECNNLAVAGKHVKIQKEIEEQLKATEKDPKPDNKDDKDAKEQSEDTSASKDEQLSEEIASPPPAVSPTFAVKVPGGGVREIDILERTANYHMSLERQSRPNCSKYEEKVEQSRLKKFMSYKPQFNDFLGSTGKLLNEVETPNQVQRLHAKAKASEDLDEEALHNVMITQNKKLLMTSGEHDILIGSLRNRHDREIIQQVARVKTMLRIMDEVMNDQL